ncbi:MAG TPA: oligosaccharide flippase family protein [Nitrospirota bacterium]|nr:oligosaccharide flippase family protein [Nitrospirota bacterium]
MPPFVALFVARVRVSPLGYRLASGTFWSLVGTLSARGLSLLAAILLARRLGKEGFGEFGIIQGTVVSLSAIIAYGLGLTATKHIAENREKDSERAGRIMALSGIVSFASSMLLAVCLAIFAPWVASQTLAAPHLSSLLRISALYFFLISLNGAQTGSLAGFHAFRTIAWVNLQSGIATFIFMVCGVLLGGLYGAVWSLVASGAFGWLVTHLAVRREAAKAGVPFSFTGVWRELAVLKSFSLPAVLASTLFGPVGWVCSAILVNKPGGYAQMGIFNATNQWFGLVMFLPGLLGQVVLPMLAESVGAGDNARSRRILKITVLANAFVVVPLVLVISIASPWLLSLYGAGFAPAWPVLVISIVTAGLVAIVSPVSQSLNAEGRLWIAFFLNLCWALLFIIMTELLIDRGAAGLVAARLIAYLFQSALVLFLVYRSQLNRKKVVEITA